MKISVIIPCFNECSTVDKILDKVLKNKDFIYEIIIIDDFSTDGSREILKNIPQDKIDHLILNEKNYGKGYSIRQGLKMATGDIILIQDADLEYDPNDYQKLINPILKDQADIVYGTRFMGSNEKRVLYFWHTLGNNFLTFISNMLTNLNLSDMECGFKVFKKKC